MGICELSEDRKSLYGVLVLSALIFVVAFLMVFHRNENPEWKQYQLRGVALGVSLLNHELENEQGVEKRKEIE